MNRRRGFTLIELLVVVAILAALIAILVPSLSRARDMAKKTICATNLKGQGSAFAIYAAQYSDYLPSSPGGNWLHDQSVQTCDALVGTQLSSSLSATSIRKWFYCPTNFDANVDLAWIGNGNFRYLDYAYFNGRNCNTTLPITRVTGKGPKIAYKTKLNSTFNASSAELVTDEILTSSPGGSDFHVPNAASLFHEYSSHLKGNKPSGMNVLACDGHVSWRAWPKAGLATPIPQSGGPNSFWMVDP